MSFCIFFLCILYISFQFNEIKLFPNSLTHVSGTITKLMAKALDNVTVTKYYLPRIVMPTSNRMKTCGNILDQKEVVPCSYKDRLKTLNISKEKEKKCGDLDSQSP